MKFFGKFDPRRRFFFLLLIIYIVSIPVISSVSYLILKQGAVKDAYNMARLYLTTYASTRYYVGAEMIPALEKEWHRRFVLVGISRYYVAGRILRTIMQEFPGYIFKDASLNPRNLENKADEFETGIINEFRQIKAKEEWIGMVTKRGHQYYVLARPGEPLEKSCLYCHGDPAFAPKIIKERYGPTAGFNMKAGELTDALIAYIPIDLPLTLARRTVLFFIGAYSILFALILWLINRRFKWFYGKLEEDNKTIEEVSSEILDLNRDIEDLVAERTMSMVGLRIADRIRNPITVIGGTCKQLLKKEMEESSKEKLREILTECQKMEETVVDFDELAKGKRFLFGREDLNEMVSSTMRLMEPDIKSRGIALSVELYDKPLMFNANRELIKIVIRHVISNAVDATIPGGKITVSSGIKDNNLFLIINDTGKGMTQEETHRAFEPFYSTKGRTGMGLPLVKQIVMEHMGEVVIESKVGTGTTVRFLFPARWREREYEEF